jgi:hypothetical protein
MDECKQIPETKGGSESLPKAFGVTQERFYELADKTALSVRKAMVSHDTKSGVLGEFLKMIQEVAETDAEAVYLLYTLISVYISVRDESGLLQRLLKEVDR